MSNQFKRMTPENWKTGDDIFHWPQPIAEDKWVKACLGPQLKPIVPQDIRELFEVARGSMIYGWFYYPLITLAKEQFARIMETAARERCRQLGIAPARINKKGEKKRTALCRRYRSSGQAWNNQRRGASAVAHNS
jgi:hypothetical protein